MFEDGFFQLNLDDTIKSASILDYEGKLNNIPADIGAIKEILKKEYKRIFERDFIGEEFFKKLLSNYLSELRRTVRNTVTLYLFVQLHRD